MPKKSTYSNFLRVISLVLLGDLYQGFSVKICTSNSKSAVELKIRPKNKFLKSFPYVRRAVKNHDYGPREIFFSLYSVQPRRFKLVLF